METAASRLVGGVLCVLVAECALVCCASRSKMSGEDAGDVTWAHAVNSRAELEKALSGPIDFLEADISMGHVIGNEQVFAVPIMAHPPDATSDISLDSWLDAVSNRRPEKGLKLDFKSIEVVEPSLLILQKYSSKLNSVWLNADVLPGPIDAPATPVSAEQFLALCRKYFPEATLSTGWTTHLSPFSDPISGKYGWQHVREMADIVHCEGSKNNFPKFTFPVRGIFASRSIKRLQWLLSVVPNSTLTVWTGKVDPLKIEDLLRLRASFPKDRVFYDLPGSIGEIFQLKKRTVDVPDLDWTPDSGLWTTLTKGQTDTSCLSSTYVRDDTFLFGKELTTAVLRKSVITLGETSRLKMTGKIKFFDAPGRPAAHPREGYQELTIVFTDVGLFSKNAPEDPKNELDLTTGDGEIIWSAINSSAAYTFRHMYGQDGASCRLFKLDTSEDKTFEVWTVPCDEMLDGESLETISKKGNPEISSRKRLVTPKGPFMLGFVSAGDEHVAIYDLEIDTRGGTVASGSNSVSKAGLFSVGLSLLCLLLLLL